MTRLRVSESIVPLSDFKARTSNWLRHVNEIGGPLVLTQNGRAAGVLLSPREFDAMAEKLRFVEAVREGLEDTDGGRTRPHDLMVAEARKRYGSNEP